MVVNETIVTQNFANSGGGGIYCTVSNNTYFHSSIYRNINNNDISCGNTCAWDGFADNPCTEACITRDICSGI
jgi:predicted outer membrane repeat protein